MMNEKLRKTALFTTLSVLIGGCADIPGAPGHISQVTSTFDQATELSMEPAFVYRAADGFSGSDLELALLWRSTMKPGDLILEAYVDGAETIAHGKSLHFNIDGEIIDLVPAEQFTNIVTDPGVSSGIYIPPRNISSIRYLITRDFLIRILTAKDVRVRLDLARAYVEGVFSDDTTSAARPAFREFATRLPAP